MIMETEMKDNVTVAGEGGGIIYPPDNEIWYTTENKSCVVFNAITFEKCFVYDADRVEHYYDSSLNMFVLHFPQNVSTKIRLSKRLVKKNEFYELRFPRIVSHISEVRCSIKFLYVCSYPTYRVKMYGDGNNLYMRFLDGDNLIWGNGMAMPHDIGCVSPYAFEGKTIMFDALPKNATIYQNSFLNSKFLKSFNIHAALDGYNYMGGPAFAGSNLKILCVTAVDFPYDKKLVAALRGCSELETIFVDDTDSRCVAFSGDAAKSLPGVNIIYYSQILKVDANGVIIKDK